MGCIPAVPWPRLPSDKNQQHLDSDSIFRAALRCSQDTRLSQAMTVRKRPSPCIWKDCRITIPDTPMLLTPPINADITLADLRRLSQSVQIASFSSCYSSCFHSHSWKRKNTQTHSWTPQNTGTQNASTPYVRLNTKMKQLGFAVRASGREHALPRVQQAS